MGKFKTSRISIPGRIIDLLLTDDEFFREVSAIKKASASGSFPKYDQWADDNGFHMEFALAGYAKKDLEVLCSGQNITVRSIKNEYSVPAKTESEEDYVIRDIEELSDKDLVEQIPQERIGSDVIRRVPRADSSQQRVASSKIQHGAIVSGIARRNFSTNFLIGQEFDISATKAIVKDGLLHLVVPVKTEITTKMIEIVSGE